MKKNKIDPLPISPNIRTLLKAALNEDVGKGDVTSRLLISKKSVSSAEIIAKESGVLCGNPIVKALFDIGGPSVKVKCLKKEGSVFKKNDVIYKFSGSVHAILRVERTALNFLGHLSGIATKTHSFVKKVAKDSVLILDTRKTTPLLRTFEKYAVRVGGGRNHRFGLYDAIFIKENHRSFGQLKKLKDSEYSYEIEVRNMKELREALELSPKVILFDNFKPDKLKQAVQLAREKRPEIILEASGGINIDNVAHYSSMGVDWISVGSLTHSVKAVDFSLILK